MTDYKAAVLVEGYAKQRHVLQPSLVFLNLKPKPGTLSPASPNPERHCFRSQDLGLRDLRSPVALLVTYRIRGLST